MFFVPGAFGYFEVTDDITKYTKASIFGKVGKKTPLAIRFSTVGKYKRVTYPFHLRSRYPIKVERLVVLILPVILVVSPSSSTPTREIGIWLETTHPSFSSGTQSL